MQTLYEWDFRPKSDISEIKSRNIVNYKEDVDEDFINKSIKGIIDNQKIIDNEIVKAAPEWPIEQISSIDKIILRVSVYEILFTEDIPKNPARAARLLCDRHYGVGADGLVLIMPPDNPEADVMIRIFNPDGSEERK